MKTSRGSNKFQAGDLSQQSRWGWSYWAFGFVAACSFLMTPQVCAFQTIRHPSRQSLTSGTRLEVLSEPNVNDTKLRLENKPNTTTRRRLREKLNKKSKVAPVEVSNAAKKKRRRTRSKDFFLTQSMVQHDILTKEQDLQLGAAVQQSLKLRKELDSLLEQKRLEREQVARQFEKEDSAMQSSRDELDEEEDENLSHLSIYGMQTLHEEENFSEQEALSWIARDQALGEERETNSLMASVRKQEIYDHSDQQVISFDSPILRDLHLISDQEIVSKLKVDRAEVVSILLKGAQARDTLIRSNIRLVVGIVKRWSRMNTGRDDGSLHSTYRGGWDRPSVDEAVQEGILGLAIAAERYEPERGLRFSTYATHWIVNYVRLCFQRTSTGVLKLPVKYYETKSKFRALVKHYYETEGVVPPFEDLAKELGTSEKRLNNILKLTRPLVSTDAPRRPGGNTRAGKAGTTGEDELLLSDTLVDDKEPKPEDRIELSFLRQCLENAMATELAPHERDVLRLRLGLDDGVSRSCRQVAEEFGSLTTSQVRSTEQRAFAKLRSPRSLATYKLMTYLDIAGVDRETMTLR